MALKTLRDIGGGSPPIDINGKHLHLIKNVFQKDELRKEAIKWSRWFKLNSDPKKVYENEEKTPEIVFGLTDTSDENREKISKANMEYAYLKANIRTEILDWIKTFFNLSDQDIKSQGDEKQMKDYYVNLKISAECKDDARELLEVYTGKETSIEINSVEDEDEYDSRIREESELIRSGVDRKMKTFVASCEEFGSSVLSITEKDIKKARKVVEELIDIQEVK